MPILETRRDQSALRRILRAISDALFGRRRNSSEQLHSEAERSDGRGCARAEPRSVKALRQRMAEEVARLQRLDSERKRRGDSRYGMTTEDRIIWRELIELELQEIDEKMRRIGGAARASERGTHERDDA